MKNKKRNILITAIGYGGSNSLVNDIYNSNLNIDHYNFYGSNVNYETIARSCLKKNFLLPHATDSKYKKSLIRLIEEESIDLIIPNSDAEVGKISEIRDELKCKLFLPSKDPIKTSQNKYDLYLKLHKNNIPVPISRDITSFEDIEKALSDIGGNKFWIRPKTGSGSKGATWVNNIDQAISWIKLWVELRDYKIDQFTISEYLPGRDYCFQSTWKNGELLLAKMCERLSYYAGEQRLSGMSSTPSTALTVRDEQALDTVFRAIKAITKKANGNISFDLKGNENGEMCITECNIGRFCMITSIFNRTGRYNMAEMYIRAAFDEEIDIQDPIDISEGHYLLRELDILPTIIHKDKIRSFAKSYL